MKIKICGITNIEDAQLCSTLGADALGFIFYKKSKRYISPKEAKKIISQLPPFVLKVGVFVNEKPFRINEISKEVKLHLVQLHGEETQKDIDIIDLPVVKAFRINEKFNFQKLEEFKNCSYLFDSFDESEYGGTGKKFVWKNIPDEIKTKIILAGGITSDDLKIVLTEINPYAIDVSSSIESKPGKKDHKKLKLLFEKINELRNL